jgi:hypothetical protein
MIPRPGFVDLVRSSKAIYVCEVDSLSSRHRLKVTPIEDLKTQLEKPIKIKVNTRHLKEYRDFPKKGMCVVFTNSKSKRYNYKDLKMVYACVSDTVQLTHLNWNELKENGYVGKYDALHEVITTHNQLKSRFGQKIPLAEFKLAVQLIQSPDQDFKSKLTELETGSFSYAVCNILIKQNP